MTVAICPVSPSPRFASTFKINCQNPNHQFDFTDPHNLIRLIGFHNIDIKVYPQAKRISVPDHHDQVLSDVFQKIPGGYSVEKCPDNEVL